MFRSLGTEIATFVLVLRLHSFFFKKKPPVPIVLECHFEPVCEICALFTFGEIGKNNKPMRHKNTAPLTATNITAGPTSESESSIVAAVKNKQ